MVGDTVARTSPLRHCHSSCNALPDRSPVVRICSNVSSVLVATSTNSTVVMLEEFARLHIRTLHDHLGTCDQIARDSMTIHRLQGP
jgi:hypothetical protein